MRRRSRAWPTSRASRPQEYADRIVEAWRALPARLGVAPDFFIRTSDDGHKRFVQEFLQRIRDNGRDDIYQDVYAGLYCVGCEAFKTEDELVDGKCPEHDIEPEWIEERNWFFRLSAYQEQLLALYDERPDFVLPAFRANEARSFIAGGLQDFSISREGLSWGIPIPWDPDQVAYVWADALVNYLSALTYARPGEDLDPAVLAGRPASAREGHPALPLRLLARDAARRGLRRAAPALRPRLPAARRPQDLEVARERRRPARPRRRLRRRPGPLLVRALRLVRAGRHGVGRRASASATSASSGTTSATCSRGRPRWSRGTGKASSAPCRRPDSEVAAILEPLGATSRRGSTCFDLTGALERIWEVVRGAQPARRDDRAVAAREGRGARGRARPGALRPRRRAPRRRRRARLLRPRDVASASSRRSASRATLDWAEVAYGRTRAGRGPRARGSRSSRASTSRRRPRDRHARAPRRVRRRPGRAARPRARRPG